MRSWGKTELTPNQQRALTELSPCDHCHQRDRCARYELACGDFLRWQTSGRLRNRDRNPNPKLYRKIFTAS
ncbi:hypothetical protein [Microbulbifer sp. TYP-18]|uniref:hypothetical protein n=1 Tax=Microbulbifer sp. TYP-18 TaxID=3230024 RepID=UPI0034C5DF8C